MEDPEKIYWYDRSWLVILLTFVFFPVGLYGLWKNQSIGKGWKIGLTAFIAVCVVASLAGDKTRTSTTATVADQSQKEWIEVQFFKGSGMKKSPVFTLTGAKARIRYAYKSSSDDIGAFALYIVDEGKQIMKDGGIPEVMISESSPETESALYKDAGNYYIDVNASGQWAVSVDELR